MAKKSLFSQEAIDKLRTPEKLDTLLHVTTTRSWIAVVAILLMLVGVVIWSFMGSFTVKTDGMGMLMDSGGIVSITPESSGRILEITAVPGEKIKKGETVAKINNFNQPTNDNICSYYDGVVDEVAVRAGDVINAGESICTVRLTDDGKDLSGIFYVPVEQSKKIKAGMTIQLSPSGVNIQNSGCLIGIVRSISDYPVSMTNMQRTLANDQMPQLINQSLKSAAVEVKFDLVKDENDESGYLWSSTAVNHEKITPGTFVSGSIVVESQPPIQKVFYKLSQLLWNR